MQNIKQNQKTINMLGNHDRKTIIKTYLIKCIEKQVVITTMIDMFSSLTLLTSLSQEAWIHTREKWHRDTRNDNSQKNRTWEHDIRVYKNTSKDCIYHTYLDMSVSKRGQISDNIMITFKLKFNILYIVMTLQKE